MSLSPKIHDLTKNVQGSQNGRKEGNTTIGWKGSILVSKISTWQTGRHWPAPVSSSLWMPTQLNPFEEQAFLWAKVWP